MRRESTLQAMRQGIFTFLKKVLPLTKTAGAGWLWEELLQELVLGRVWCQHAWELCLWVGRKGPRGCELVYMCVYRKRAGGVDIQGVLDWGLECQSSLYHMSAL